MLGALVRDEEGGGGRSQEHCPETGDKMVAQRKTVTTLWGAGCEWGSRTRLLRLGSNPSSASLQLGGLGPDA